MTLPGNYYDWLKIPEEIPEGYEQKDKDYPQIPVRFPGRVKLNDDTEPVFADDDEIIDITDIVKEVQNG